MHLHALYQGTPLEAAEKSPLYQGTTFIRAAKHHEATKSRRDGRK
jgi:hypothetical protein